MCLRMSFLKGNGFDWQSEQKGRADVPEGIRIIVLGARAKNVCCPRSFVALSHRMALSVLQAGKAEERFAVCWGLVVVCPDASKRSTEYNHCVLRLLMRRLKAHLCIGLTFVTKLLAD